MYNILSTSMKRFLLGAFGAFLPDIVLFWSKRFTAPLLTFEITQYAIVTLLYMISAGIVASIYPYRKRQQKAWHAVVIGIVFPTLLAGLISAADRMSTREGLVTLRGPSPAVSEPVKIPGTLLDLLAAF